jgi:hypothetical protein
VGDRGDQFAVLRAARLHDWAFLAAFHQRLPGVKLESGHAYLFAVALETALLKNRDGLPSDRVCRCEGERNKKDEQVERFREH